jgi:hypothetical protein
MKAGLLATASVLLLCSAPVAFAQSSGPNYSDTIHQSAGDRDSRGTPKYYQPAHHRHHRHHRHYRTPGYGGPAQQNSIHQSAGDRDSRGTPKDK